MKTKLVKIIMTMLMIVVFFNLTVVNINVFAVQNQEIVSTEKKAIEDSQINLETKYINDVNKKWTIKFNKNVDKSTIDENVFVTTDKDGLNKVFSVEVDIDEQDHRKIIISNSVEWDLFEDYYIFVKNGVKSIVSENLLKDVVMRFVVTPYLHESQKMKEYKSSDYFNDNYINMSMKGCLFEIEGKTNFNKNGWMFNLTSNSDSFSSWENINSDATFDTKYNLDSLENGEYKLSVYFRKLGDNMYWSQLWGISVIKQGDEMFIPKSDIYDHNVT